MAGNTSQRRVLLDETPLMVLPKLAEAIGLNEALLLQQIHYWSQLNQRNGKETKEGHYWTYQTLEGWQRQMPFWSVMTIRRTIMSLNAQGLIITGTHNKHARDRTRWYRPNYENIEKLTIPSVQNEHMASVQNERMHEVKMNTPLPENNLDKQREKAPPPKKHAHQAYKSTRNDDAEIAAFYESITERFDG